MPPDPYDPQQAAAYPPTTTNPAATAQLPSSNVTDYPAAEVQAVPVAMAQLAHARAVFSLSETNLQRVVTQLREDFEYSSQLVTAVRGQKMAYDRYLAAQNHVLATLQEEPQYQALKHLRDDLEKTLGLLQGNPTANKSRIEATAAVQLQYGTKLSQMEADAFLADKDVQDAKAQFLDASNHLADLRAQFERSIRRDATFVAARNQLDDARIQRTTSDALLVGAVQARDIAVDYAYSLHQYDQYRYLSAGGLGWEYPYGGYGYGYGYGIGGYPVPLASYSPYDHWRR